MHPLDEPAVESTPEQTPQPPPLPPERRPFQWSLWSMFVLTTVVAGCFSLILGTPDWLIGPLFWMTAIIIPPVLLTLMIWGNPDQRAFGLGAIFPSGYLLLSILGLAPRHHELLTQWFGWHLSWDARSLSWSVVWLIAAASGWICVVVRRRLHRSS
ncbi:MAG: hypothetical protein JW818_17050 [Pirellulales bacterium]|nr:hypothetical protein [Pirellulales bacterium]